jgi:hypothetical protein
VHEGMSEQEHYAWGALFDSPWDRLVEGMAERAAQLGMHQTVEGERIVWTHDGSERVRWAFVNDPSDIEAVRRVYNDDDTLRAPVCFVVVRQPDPSDARGDVIFDIFRLDSTSYLWHFNRVYTPPKAGDDA